MAFIDEQGRRHKTREDLARANPDQFNDRYSSNRAPGSMSESSRLQWQAFQDIYGGGSNEASTDPTQNVGDDFTSSSTGFRGTRDTLENDVFGKYDEEGDAAKQAFDKGWDDRLTQYETRLEEDMARINEQWDIRREEVEGQQKQETGTTSLGLARMGGYLGGSAGETGALLGLAKSHRNEISLLESQRSQAISSAKRAMEDKRFQVAQMKLEESKQIDAEIENRKSSFIKNSLEIEEENRERLEDARDFALDNGIKKPAYTLDGVTFFDTRTGQEIDDIDMIGEGDYQILDPSQNADKFETKTIGGEYVRFGFNKDGDVVSRTVLGKSKSTSSGSGTGSGDTTYNITSAQKRKAESYLKEITSERLTLSEVLEEAPIEIHEYLRDKAGDTGIKETKNEEVTYNEIGYADAKTQFNYAVEAVQSGEDFEAVVQALLNNLRIGEGSYRQPSSGYVNLKDSEAGIRARLKNATK